MRTLNITNEEIKWLKMFGNPSDIVRDAVYFFIRGKIETKVQEYRNRCLFFEQKYDSTYHRFVEKINSDEKYIEAINAIHPLWESDLIQWEFCHKELEEWTKRLEDISRR